ncbi:stage III sporulation protein SpoIIIAB [Paenibacillus dendritiformis]|uniref:Stage III sporulation protein AB n=1 Tax=Paenibacillus dendritiformis C454 TaxID=1131935 RepID=H3SFE1_9BACL|nr:stage III sporulation protein SpoIIIAB [Paenibacillus dendritiformis]EHQ62170.1 stage III sporulation protein AB [Paenibacillus dendritiformis C454]PZM64362.1 stage III sporulation protein AB [Paenibacillus dendritiformis]TDL54200.1 stage III sporulation protein AB [Paenibacillus dendritiformis]WGU95361.1 stage III sporulation protein SpoIIIAB [Paenibacillus dendritiformis]CAH8771582.1 stage III sporulation protein AB [Paenibacillus dendritiformis]
MFKLLGSALLIAAAASIGWLKAASYAARPKQLRLLNHALQRLETAIMYGHTPLAAAFAEISRQLPSPLRAVFADAAQGMDAADAIPLTAREAWQLSWERHRGNTALANEDLRILLELGYSLGISDRDDQRKHIRHAIKQLEQEEFVAREEYQRYGTMCRSLGVLSGLLAVILMY